MIQLKTRIHLGIEVFRNHSHKQNLEQGTEEEWKSDTQNRKCRAHLTVGIKTNKQKKHKQRTFLYSPMVNRRIDAVLLEQEKRGCR